MVDYALNGRRDFIEMTLALSAYALWAGDSTFAEGPKMADTKGKQASTAILSYEDVRSVSPTLEHYTKGALIGGVWKRPELSPRDRSLVTVAALITRLQTIEMPFHFALALDNGVTPAELSETITHLAFYAGWANAMAAVAVAKEIFRQRGIGVDQLPPARDKLLSINEEAEKQRATQVSNDFGVVSPGLVENTTDLLFRELWLRPALKPRDRSLVTVSSLIANNQSAQVADQPPRTLSMSALPCSRQLRAQPPTHSWTPAAL